MALRRSASTSLTMKIASNSIGIQFMLCIVLLGIAFGLSQAQSDKCNVGENEKLLCGDSDITRADCEAKKCCFEEQQCYYGNTVTVQCTRDGQFVVVVARDVTIPHLALSSVSLLGGRDSPCSPVGTTAAFALFQFPVTACGTRLKAEEGYVVYENVMSSTYEVLTGPSGSITRDSVYKLVFQCWYSGSDFVPLVAEVNTVAPPPPIAARGSLRVELRLARDYLYDSYYDEMDYPITKVLQQPLFVEVRVLELTDPNIALSLGGCWASSTPSPDSLPQWTLLVDGCPYKDDNRITTLVPVSGSPGLPNPTHYKRFIVHMLTFVAADVLIHLKETVFIHCSAAVCHHSTVDHSEQRCNRQRRDVFEVQKGSSREAVVVSSGEVVLSVPDPPALSNIQTDNEGIDVAVVQNSEKAEVSSWEMKLTDPRLPVLDFRTSFSKDPQCPSYGLLGVAASTVIIVCAAMMIAACRSRASLKYDCNL